MSGGRSQSYDGYPPVGTVQHKLRIGQRDGWVCGICHRPVDPDLSVYDSEDAATVDHIVPRLAGGTHEDDNLQIAHYRCNYRCNVDKGTSGYVGRSRQRRRAKRRAATEPQPQG